MLGAGFEMEDNGIDLVNINYLVKMLLSIKSLVELLNTLPEQLSTSTGLNYIISLSARIWTNN